MMNQTDGPSPKNNELSFSNIRQHLRQHDLPPNDHLQSLSYLSEELKILIDDIHIRMIMQYKQHGGSQSQSYDQITILKQLHSHLQQKYNELLCSHSQMDIPKNTSPIKPSFTQKSQSRKPYSYVTHQKPSFGKILQMQYSVGEPEKQNSDQQNIKRCSKLKILHNSNKLREDISRKHNVQTEQLCKIGNNTCSKSSAPCQFHTTNQTQDRKLALEFSYSNNQKSCQSTLSNPSSKNTQRKLRQPETYRQIQKSSHAKQSQEVDTPQSIKSRISELSWRGRCNLPQQDALQHIAMCQSLDMQQFEEQKQSQNSLASKSKSRYHQYENDENQ